MINTASSMPSVLVGAIVGLGMLVYWYLDKKRYASHASYSDSEVDEEQKVRLRLFPAAERLQLETNYWHARAIASKKRYEVIGVAACMAAPSLIWMIALEVGLVDAGYASYLGIALAHTVVACGLLFLMRAYRSPSRDHVVNRLRAECFRLHLHCYLAGVGPYALDLIGASESVDRMRVGTTIELLHELRTIEGLCRDHVASADAFLSFPDYSARHAQVYWTERVQEQLQYFAAAVTRVNVAYTMSQRIMLVVIIAAAITPLIPLALKHQIDSAPYLFYYPAGIGVLILGLRSVLSWESKTELYIRQEGQLKELLSGLTASLGRADTKEGAMVFRRLASRFEGAMAREACDWALISEKRIYDVGI